MSKQRDIQLTEEEIERAKQLNSPIHTERVPAPTNERWPILQYKEEPDKKKADERIIRSFPYNFFHQLTEEETEELGEIQEPQLGVTNLNGAYSLDPKGDELKKTEWQNISRVQPNGEEEQYDSYGLRRFWDTSKPRRNNTKHKMYNF